MKQFVFISVFYLVLFNLVQLAARLVVGGAYHFSLPLGLIVPTVCALVSFFEGRRRRLRRF